MLVLSRRIGEEIVVDGNITIRVTAIKGGRVVLGVTAPVSVPVQRLERAHHLSAHDPGTAGPPTDKPPAISAA